MASIFDKPRAFGWPRAQRFQLTGQGSEAESSYRETVAASRAVPGRAAFEKAQSSWAGPLGLDAADGPCLGELAGGARTVQQLVEALETCGSTVAEVRTAVTRLVEKGLLAAMPPSE